MILYLVSLIKVVRLNSLDSFLVLGAWVLGPHSWLGVIIGVLESQKVYMA